MQYSVASSLRFYFITDDGPTDLSMEDQVRIAVTAGATMVQYRKKHFETLDFEQALGLRNFCAVNHVPFIVNDNILLARAIEADGVHLGQCDEKPETARKILGEGAIIGISVSTPGELARTDLTFCDYIGTGPVYATSTKPDAKQEIGTGGLREIAEKVPLPVVAIGGISPENAGGCFSANAAGVAVISTISRSPDPEKSAAELSRVCGTTPGTLLTAWEDEFLLINELIGGRYSSAETSPLVRVGAGDDAALLASLENPVITTDTQREGVHFHTGWQTMEEIGRKSVEITFSDLAASYAAPVGLFVNLGIPDTVSSEDILDLYRGIDTALKLHGAALGGGNVSSAPRLGLDLFAVGEGGAIFPRRSAARPGDGLYATGPLGLARAGLNCLMKNDESFSGLVDRFKLPQARFEAARVLAGNGIGCVMDISDGLAGDAGHIAEASGVTVHFEPESFDVSPELKIYCDSYGLDPGREILAGGEDYELLFACSMDIFDKVRRQLPGAHRVGRILEYDGRHLAGLPHGVGSFRHGKT